MRDSSEGQAVIEVPSNKFDLVVGDSLHFVFLFEWKFFLTELDDCFLFHFEPLLILSFECL